MSEMMAYSYCQRIKTDGIRCNSRIPANKHMCESCRAEKHRPACPSPRDECICGYSRLFWLEVRDSMQPREEHL